MAKLALQNLVKAYAGIPAVCGVNLDLADGEFVTLLGPSGCGKTTCLRMVAGFVQPDSGSIRMDGDNIVAKPPHLRDMGMVFQSYALFPHQTVAENIAFGLKFRAMSRAERDARVKDALALVQLEGFASRYPAQLSGGQKQRVALARAVVIRPKILLLDEPLGALDLKLREELQQEIKRVQSKLGITTLFVTHDQGEALSMSDRIAVMRAGKIVQLGTPSSIYTRPNCVFAANFVGRTNLVPVRYIGEDGDWSVVEISEKITKRFKVAGPVPQAERIYLAMRPEHLVVTDQAEQALRGQVLSIEYKGSSWNIELLAEGLWKMLAQVPTGLRVPQPGDDIFIRWHEREAFLLADGEPRESQ
jgi:spermidine/putrescine ABC transporter ATP-binding subunit